MPAGYGLKYVVGKILNGWPVFREKSDRSTTDIAAKNCDDEVFWGMVGRIVFRTKPSLVFISKKHD